jgi:hypothetical protein
VTVATNLSYAIRWVSEVTPAAGGLRLMFRDGSGALLETSHPRFAVCRINAESRRGRAMPVGVLLDGQGRVVDLNAAHGSSRAGARARQ